MSKTIVFALRIINGWKLSTTVALVGPEPGLEAKVIPALIICLIYGILYRDCPKKIINVNCKQLET